MHQIHSPSIYSKTLFHLLFSLPSIASNSLGLSTRDTNIIKYCHSKIPSLYYSAIKKNKILPFAATWMDLEGTERQILYDITYMWNLKQYNKLVNITKKKQIHIYRE